MPLITREQDFARAGLNVGQFADAARAERMKDLATERLLPTFSQQTAAAFEEENEVIAAIKSKSLWADDTIDPKFFLEDHLTEDEKNSNLFSSYARAMNAGQLEAIRSDIKRSQKNQEIAAQGGTSGNVMSSMIAGVASPLTLLPGGVLIKGEKAAATVGARAAKGALGSGRAQVLKSAAGTAGIAVASIGASEAILQTANPTRTLDQSVMAMSGAAVLGGMLGGVAAKLSKTEFNKLATKLEEGINSAPVVKPSPELDQFMRSVGAAQVEKLGLNDFAISGKAARNVSYATRFVNPYGRLMNSPFTASREIFTGLAENSLVLNMHKEGISTGAAAETLQKQFDKYKAETGIAIREGLRAVKKGEKTKGIAVSAKQYGERVSAAMRNGDIDAEYPEVTAVAQRLRKIVDEVAKHGQDVGLLPEKLTAKYAQSYLPRIWDKAKMIADPKGSKDVLRQAASNLIENERKSIEQNLAGIGRMYEKRISDIMGRKARAAQILGEEKAPTKIELSAVSEYEDSVKELMGKDIKQAEVNNYLSENNLEEVAQAVNVVNSKMPKKPKGLYEYAKSQGGLLDQGGELENLGIRFGRKKVYYNEGQSSILGAGDSVRGAGKKITLDEFTERAYEAGYYAERPSVSEMLDDLADDFNDVSPRYSVNDSDIVDNYIMTRQAKEEAEAFLSEIPSVDPKTFWRDVKEVLSDRKVAAREIKAEAAATGKAVREGARRVRDNQKELRVEVKKLRAARAASANKMIRDADSALKRINERKEMKRLKFEERGRIIADPGEADLIAEDMYVMLTQSKGDVPEWVSPIVKGIFKNKAIPVMDNIAAPYLKNDIVEVMSSYLRQASGDIALSAKFGSPTMDKQLAELSEEFNAKLDNPALTTKERAKLKKQHDSDVRDLTALRDIMRGSYNLADPDSVIHTGAQALKSATYMANMGGVLLSSMADVTMPIISHGFQDTFGTIPKLASLDAELSKLNIEDLKMAGLLYEHENATRMMSLADISDPNQSMNRLTRTMSEGSQLFSQATGITWWNNKNKAINGVITQQYALRHLEKGSKATKEEITELRRLGITERNGKIILDQFKRHGGKSEDGLYISGASKWDTSTKDLRDAGREWAAAIRKSTDETVITAGIAEKPLMAHSVIGSIPFQFTGYMFAAHQKITMANLQSADAAAITGLLSMTMIGGLIAAIKQKETELSYELQGREYKGVRLKDWDTNMFFYKAVQRANPAPLLFDANDRFERIGGYGLSSALGTTPVNKYTNSSKAATFMGAGFSYGENVLRAITLPFKDETTANDVNAAFKLLPARNMDAVFGFRFILDKIQGKVSPDEEIGQ